VLNICERTPEWPHVPEMLYIGHDKHNQMKVYPFPPDPPYERWAQPYSIRSFVAQASRWYSGCAYSTAMTGAVMGKAAYSDVCSDGEVSFGAHENERTCHLVAGFTLGQPTCKLWERIAALCQTDIEKRFLQSYLGLVKDRQFPMLIPQARMGIAERRRPDFVVFVPLQYFHYKWYAVQLDAAHPEHQNEADQLRNAEIAVHGYEVLSLRGQNYVEEVKRLVEQIEGEMDRAESDDWSVAVEVAVLRTENPETNVPF
jgi:hypothetical protein